MDMNKLRDEGLYSVFGRAGARMEMPGCSLCMGNQAQCKEGSTVVSTSTRNFPNRLGKDTKVFLASAELCAVTAKLGHIPTAEEYMENYNVINSKKDELYVYMNFNEVPEYAKVAETVK